MRSWLSRLLPVQDQQELEQPTTPQIVLPFGQVEGSLALYAKAMSDGALRVNSSAGAARACYTDGRTIFLPPEVSAETLDEARRLYRMMIAWKVAQVREGVLDIEAIYAGNRPGVALAIYEVLQGERVDRQVAAIWPGLAQDLAVMRAANLARRDAGDLAAEPLPEALLRALLQIPLDGEPTATAIVSSIAFRLGGGAPLDRLLDQVPEALSAPSLRGMHWLSRELGRYAPLPSDEAATRSAAAPVDYRGRIRPELIRRLAPRWDDDPLAEAAEPASNGKPQMKPRPDPIQIEGRSAEQRPLRNRRSSRGGRQAVQLSLGDREPSWTFKQVPLTEEEKRGAILYDEWDCRENRYQPEWCALRQRGVRSGNPEPVERILRQNRPLVTRLKQQFEALRPERLRLTRQFDGDGLDLNAIVNDHADRRAGFSAAEKLYSRTLERERNIALGCLIDLSGSTGAWIDDDPRNDQVIEVTRRALVFLCEALTVLDDRYAIYGFSGSTRKRCDISVVKAFEEPYGETIKGRIAGLAPGAYTRIGPAVRHTTQLLIRQPARVRLLLLISDGRPNDFDGYGGRYGIEDTRRALVEARQRGVATFALTIDAEARDYMPHMFGRGHYVVVEDAPALATKLADVYRRLTVQ